MLILSILIICLAHYTRVKRWELFVNTYEQPREKTLLEALSVGYLLNFFLPYKTGDLVRAFMAGKKMRNGKGYALATVILDRCLDVIIVGTVFGFLTLFSSSKSSSYTCFKYYIWFSIILFFLFMLVIILRNCLKKLIKLFASFFNSTLEEKVLRFFWSLIWSFKDILVKSSKGKLLLYTASMWSLYFISYWCFGVFLSGKGYCKNWTDVYFTLFDKNSFVVKGFITSPGFYWYALYYLVPSIILLTVAFILRPMKHLSEDNNFYTNLLPHVNEEERRKFLELYFSGKRNDFIENYLQINRDVLIQCDCSAGSNATTILCSSGERYFYRKYAFHKDGDKLYEQIQWILKYQDRIPLPKIMTYVQNNDECYYDMPYNTNLVGLFYYAHSNPKESAWHIIRDALLCLENTIYKDNVRKADAVTIEKYIQQKVIINIDKIESAKWLQDIMKYSEVIINGKSYNNISFYKKYLSVDHMIEVFKNDNYSAIHGDLTIENIICIKNQDQPDDYYFIDPNTGNIHDSSNLDYAKLLQSIHGNYEFLMSTDNVEINQNSINFTYVKSDVYVYLWEMLDQYMQDNFSKERIRSIYYHEVIHWLRLMPYKIEKNGKRVLLFYASLLMVLSDIVSRYEE